jgi:hypothetical protein
MALEQSERPAPYLRRHLPMTGLLGCVLVVAIGLVWTFRGMRAVMDVGGSCASGGPYQVAQPCPDGALLISVAIPVLVGATLGGSLLAGWLSAPTLLLPMWAALFGSLGWNFLEYGLGDGIVWGWLVCGVVFELMALPALAFLVAGGRLVAPSLSDPAGPEAARGPGPATWYAAYAALALAGGVAGWWSFGALS